MFRKLFVALAPPGVSHIRAGGPDSLSADSSPPTQNLAGQGGRGEGRGAVDRCDQEPPRPLSGADQM
jgi:hypothetical protein